MKIEVAIEGREPYSHPINKDKTIIGWGDESDLVLKIKGISRKHAIVVMEDDQYYVVDQGSAGGTFINEEQLVPGQRAEFTSFFPIRLGEFVTLSLLSDEEETRTFEFGKALAASEEQTKEPVRKSQVFNPSPEAMQSERRTIISPSASTKKGIEGREGVHTRKRGAAPAKAPLSDDAKSMFRTKVLAFLVAVGGTGAFFYMRNGMPDYVTETGNEAAPVAVVEKPKLSPAELIIEVPGPPIKQLGDVLVNSACSSAEEMELCQKLGLPSASASQGGIRLLPTSITLVVHSQNIEELRTQFAEVFPNEPGGTVWPETLDPRDILATYLLSLQATKWSFITDNHRWIYGIVLNPDGGYSDELFFAELPPLKKALADVQVSFNMGARQPGIQAVWPISGFFRKFRP